jgi:hypothetical protein
MERTMRKWRPSPSRALVLLAAMLALNAVLLVTQPGWALPRPALGRFFGPSMIRAEAVLKENGAVDLYRIDRGRIRAVGASSLTLRERDGLVVSIPVAAGARVALNGRAAGLLALRRGMEATVVREGDNPAQMVQAFTRR